jgi:hypothetical protein
MYVRVIISQPGQSTLHTYTSTLTYMHSCTSYTKSYENIPDHALMTSYPERHVLSWLQHGKPVCLKHRNYAKFFILKVRILEVCYCRRGIPQLHHVDRWNSLRTSKIFYHKKHKKKNWKTEKTLCLSPTETECGSVFESIKLNLSLSAEHWVWVWVWVWIWVWVKHLGYLGLRISRLQVEQAI